MWSRQLTKQSPSYTPRSVTSTSRASSDVTVWSPSSLTRDQTPPRRLARPARSSRGLGQLATDPEQLAGGPADGELVLLGAEEVTVHRMVDVDTDTAVHVHGRVGDPMACLGRPERGRAHLEVGGQILGDSPSGLGDRQPKALDVDV